MCFMYGVQSFCEDILVSDVLHRVVKLSSPILNYLIILGAVLLYVTVYLLIVPLTDIGAETVFCNVSLTKCMRQ